MQILCTFYQLHGRGLDLALHVEVATLNCHRAPFCILSFGFHNQALFTQISFNQTSGTLFLNSVFLAKFSHVQARATARVEKSALHLEHVQVSLSFDFSGVRFQKHVCLASIANVLTQFKSILKIEIVKQRLSKLREHI